jgi:ribonuclease J
VEWGYIALDGTSMIDSNSSVIRTRRKIRDDGFIGVSLVIGKKGELVGSPRISAPGCLDEAEDKEIYDVLREAVEDVIGKGARGGSKGRMLDDAIRNAVRKVIRDELGKKPVLDVHIHNL